MPIILLVDKSSRKAWASTYSKEGKRDKINEAILKQFQYKLTIKKGLEGDNEFQVQQLRDSVKTMILD